MRDPATGAPRGAPPGHRRGPPRCRNVATARPCAPGGVGASRAHVTPSAALGRLTLVGISVLLALGSTAGPAVGQRGLPPSFARIVQTVAPAVVTISAVVEPKTAGTELREDEEPDEAGPIGSGVIIDPKGVVLTNAHVADAARRSR